MSNEVKTVFIPASGGVKLSEGHQHTLEKATLVRGAVADVFKHDTIFGMDASKDMMGLMYMTNCLCGEVGEVANVVKKLHRDGMTKERWAHLHEELVDVMIYLAEMIYVTDMDFDAAWEKKHSELRDRWIKKAAAEVMK